MFFIPSMQDIEIISEDERRVNKNTKDYIYLEKDGKVLKFLVSIPHLDITTFLEKYLENLPVNEYNIMKESKVKESRWPLKLVRYVGNFKMQGACFKTKNYLVPNQTELSSFLCKKHRKNYVMIPLNTEDLKALNEINKNCLEDEETFELDIINTLKSNIQIQLEETYDIDLEQLGLYIQNIEKLLGNDESRRTLDKLRYILLSSEKNKNYIGELGLEDRFIQTIEKEKQKVK